MSDSTPLPPPATEAKPSPASRLKEAFHKMTPRQRQLMFLAATFIVIVIIALMCPDVTTALMIIGVLLAFYVAYQEATPVDEHEGLSKSRPARGIPAAEHYTALPGAPAPYEIGGLGPRLPPDAGHYPGAIDVDEYETEAEYGHRDRTEGDNADMPYGNPFNRTRVGVPMGADACIDDEANHAEMDADELNTYQVAARNDAERVAAGTINRRREMTKYLDSELEASENRPWWGRHEL